MSKIIDSFFKTTEKPEMGRSGKVIYTLLGLIGTAFLITATIPKIPAEAPIWCNSWFFV